MVRAVSQSLFSTVIGSVFQVGFAVLKENLFLEDQSQMTEEEAGDVIDHFLKRKTETTETTTQSMSGGEEISPEALSSLMTPEGKEMLNGITTEILESDPAQLSLHLCERVLNHLESLKSFPETHKDFYEIVHNYLQEDISLLGKSHPHQLIEALRK